jgi:hypothetical protein
VHRKGSKVIRDFKGVYDRKSGYFGKFPIQKSRGYTCLAVTLASADWERSEQRRMTDYYRWGVDEEELP